MPPPHWTNQELKLYHGTLDTSTASILGAVNLARGRPRLDFGRGFYTATLFRHAFSRAVDLSLRNPGTTPAVIEFDLDRDALANSQSLWFVRNFPATQDYWSFVRYCRRGGLAHARTTHGGWYDIVAGPVASDWLRYATFRDRDQVSFHTDEAVAILDASNKSVVP